MVCVQKSTSDSNWLVCTYFIFVSCSRSCWGVPRANSSSWLAKSHVSYRPEEAVCLQKYFHRREEHQCRAARTDQESVGKRHGDPLVSLRSSQRRLQFQHCRVFWVSTQLGLGLVTVCEVDPQVGWSLRTRTNVGPSSQPPIYKVSGFVI